ncbi:MAG: TlpA family protein disulfide reductase [Bacteroides cellulosilyticus]|nr:TlpA family protein disulfide reductase [Bacteroides cellulosilyticus]
MKTGIFLILLSFLACTACRRHIVSKPDGAVIICVGNSVSDTLIYLTDDPDGGSLGGSDLPVFRFSCSDVRQTVPSYTCSMICDTLHIPFSCDHIILAYDYTPAETMHVLLRQDDTIVISRSNTLPEITFPGHPEKSFSANYDCHKAKRYGLIYGYSVEAHERIPLLLHFKFMRQLPQYRQALQEVRTKRLDDNRDEAFWLDSLLSVGLLDSVEHNYYKIRNRYQRLRMELADVSKDELKIILSTYDDTSYINGCYSFYRDYYRDAAQKYYYDKQIRIASGVIPDYKLAFRRIGEELLLHGRLRDEMLYACFRNIEALNPVTDGKNYYALIADILQDTTVVGDFHRRYDAAYARDIVFDNDLLLQDVSGTGLSFRDLLAGFVGQVVYVDFWASWCTPCMAGMPASEQLRKEYRDKEIVFVYLAFNDRPDAWKAALAKAGLEDTEHSYLVANSNTCIWVEQLKINTIPRFLLYDRQGRLVDENAPRPDSKEIRVLIDSYLL